MATITDIITKIGAANALLKSNLTSKGVTVPNGATTYAMAGLVPSIDDIVIRTRDTSGHPTVVDLSKAFTTEIPGFFAYANATESWFSFYVTQYVLPPSLKTVGTYAFYSNRNLNMPLPATLENIGDLAFANCTAMRLGSVTLPVIKTIGTKTFAANSQIISGSVVLGSTGHAVTSIGTDALQYQTAVISITVYTANGLSNDLTGAPWGAANATINYVKA